VTEAREAPCVDGILGDHFQKLAHLPSLAESGLRLLQAKHKTHTVPALLRGGGFQTDNVTIDPKVVWDATTCNRLRESRRPLIKRISSCIIATSCKLRLARDE